MSQITFLSPLVKYIAVGLTQYMVFIVMCQKVFADYDGSLTIFTVTEVLLVIFNFIFMEGYKSELREYL